MGLSCADSPTPLSWAPFPFLRPHHPTMTAYGTLTCTPTRAVHSGSALTRSPCPLPRCHHAVNIHVAHARLQACGSSPARRWTHRRPPSWRPAHRVGAGGAVVGRAELWCGGWSCGRMGTSVVGWVQQGAAAVGKANVGTRQLGSAAVKQVERTVGTGTLFPSPADTLITRASTIHRSSNTVDSTACRFALQYPFVAGVPPQLPLMCTTRPRLSTPRVALITVQL